MARKSRQHVIPQVYLKGFCDAQPPATHPVGKPLTPALWTLPPSLVGEARRVAPHNLAWERKIYNLVADDPDHPRIEEVLARLEDRYAALIRKVEAKDPLTVEDGAFIALFVGALQARSKRMMAQRQDFFDEITGFARAYMGDAADKSIEPWGELADAGKHQIMVSAEAMASDAGPHMILLENASSLPFIASDHPVVYRQLHADELHAIGIPAAWLFREIPRSARHFFILCPLNPRFAFLATQFVPPSAEPRRATLDDVRLIFRLNELSRSTADEFIISSSPAPYGPMLGAAHEHDRLRAAAAAVPRTGFIAYSERERYWMSTTALNHGRTNHPLFGRLTFRTKDIATLHQMAADGAIEHIEIFEGGASVGGMRKLRFVTVAQSPDEDSVLEQRF